MDESEAVDGDDPGTEGWIPEDLDLVEVWPLEGQPAHASVAEQAARAIQPLLARMDPLAQDRLASWLRSLVELRRAPLSPKEKWAAIRKELKEVTVLLPMVGAMGEAVKEHVWDDRTWGFRLAGGAAAVTAATVGGKKAGLAMLGTAVAVPLWVVFGAGAAFAGLIIDELEGMLDGRRAGDLPLRAEASRQVDQHAPPRLAPAEEPKGLLGAGDPATGGDEGDVDGPMDSESRDLPYPSSP